MGKVCPHFPWLSKLYDSCSINAKRRSARKPGGQDTPGWAPHVLIADITRQMTPEHNSQRHVKSPEALWPVTCLDSAQFLPWKVPTLWNLKSKSHKIHLAANKECCLSYDDSDFRVLARCRSKHHLNILEAMYIHVLKPVLCKQKSFVANLTLFKHAHSTHSHKHTE